MGNRAMILIRGWDLSFARGMATRAFAGAPIMMLAAGIACIVVALAILAPLVAPYDPNQIDLGSRLQPPGLAHLMGTDEVGRDLFSRVIHGARPSLTVGLGIVAIASIAGVMLGILSGLAGGYVDTLLMRVVDIVMALPGMVVALALTAAIGPSLWNAMIVLGVLSIPGYARLSRGQTLEIREKEFVNASRTMGAGHWRQLRTNILPNALPAILVYMSFHLGNAILASSALSFIGLGAQPPLAEWGALVNAGRSYIIQHWWYVTFPGIFIVLTALSFNLLGDGLRDWLDPQQQ